MPEAPLARRALASLCEALPGGTFATNAGPLLSSGDVYQFGVSRGWSLGRLIDVFDLHSAGEPTPRVWGFDTFTGMPEETPGEPTISIWSKGHFSPGGPDANASIARAVGGRVGWIIGDYEQTLVPTLRAERGMEPARYVDIDCDLYRSSHRALNWMFASGLVGVGTVIGYDDFWDLSCSKRGPNSQKNASNCHPFQSGEGKAHAEVAERFGVTFRCVCGPCQSMSRKELVRYESWRTYFVVESMKLEAVSDHGFHMPASQHAHFLSQNARCLTMGRKWHAYSARG